MNVNGVKRQRGERESTDAGYFGALNLLAPRPVGEYMHWNDELTFVQLRFEFMSGSTNAPITLPRTFISFCTHIDRATPPARRPCL